MQHLKSIASAALVAGLAIMLAACGGTQAPGAPTEPSAPVADANVAADAAASTAPLVTTRPRPAALAALPTVELLAPAELGAGRAPDFAWSSVDGANSYRLSVLGPDGPAWAWQGADTSVRYGGVPAGTSGPSLRAGSWWSVSAYNSTGELLALSELRAVSPEDEAGPAPSWAQAADEAGGTTDAATDPSTPAPGPVDAASEPCQLLTGDEITDAIKGDWPEPKQGGMGDFGFCDWTSANGTLLSLTVDPAANYNPDGWGADQTIDDLGSTAYAVLHGWDRRIGFVHGDFSIMLTIDYTKVDMTGFEDLAHLIDQRLP